MNKFLFLFALLILTVTVRAQSVFNGILINQSDSSAVSSAIIKLVETGKYQTTNEKGEFSFSVNPNLKTMHFEITIIGFNETVEYKLTGISPEKIFIQLSSQQLNEIEIEGLSAKQVMAKTVAAVKINYADTSYCAYSFYRQYEKLNNTFHNLIEARVAVLFRLSKNANEIKCIHSFALQQLRRSAFDYPDETTKADELLDLLNQNPVYNPEGKIFGTGNFYSWHFSFDTTQQSDDYIINFTCADYTSEHHSVENYEEAGWKGECYSTGQLQIDRGTFAVKQFDIHAYRYSGYNYPRNNNYVLPSRKYYVKFNEGHLHAEYNLFSGKWYLNKLFHSYSYDFFEAATNDKTFSFTNAFEWYADSVTRYVPAELVDSFYENAMLPYRDYQYDKNKWRSETHPFYFSNFDEMKNDLEKKKSLEEQFEAEGK